MTEPVTGYPLDEMFARIEAAVEPYPKAAMFELAAQGYDSIFEQVVSCILSIRTYDEVSLPASLALFELGRTPEAVAQLGEAAVLGVIHKVTYAERKAGQIVALAREVVEQMGGVIPADDAVVRGFKGVGPKCANLALGIAGGLARISVDVHVDRVVNRWGLVRTSSPTKTLAALEAVVPSGLKVDVNRLLMPFGKHVCTLYRPKCGSCPVEPWCQKIGVKA